ncbi:MAG: MerC domain-containing protein [Sandaracinaceae bacterium]
MSWTAANADGGEHLDHVGALASSLCAAHCVLCAVLPAAFGALGLGFFVGHQAEWGFTVVAVLFALGACALGWLRHRSIAVALLFALGIAGLVASRGLEMGHHAHAGHGHQAHEASPSQGHASRETHETRPMYAGRSRPGAPLRSVPHPTLASGPFLRTTREPPFVGDLTHWPPDRRIKAHRCARPRASRTDSGREGHLELDRWGRRPPSSLRTSTTRFGLGRADRRNAVGAPIAFSPPGGQLTSLPDDSAAAARTGRGSSGLRGRLLLRR